MPPAPAVAGGALLRGLLAVGCAPSLPKAGGSAAGGGADGAADSGSDGGSGGWSADGGSADGGSSGDGGSDGGADGGPAVDSGVEAVPTGPGPCPDLHAADAMPAYALELDPEVIAGLADDYAAGRKVERPARLRLGDEEIDATVRLKGNPSFSWFGDKHQYVVAFNSVDRDARFHGLRKIALDAPWYDPTLLRDRLSFHAMRQMDDVPAACANHATLSINGGPPLVYAHIEPVDRELLERLYGPEATGTLYKYGTDAVSNAEAADRARLAAFWGARTAAELEATGDVDQWLKVWAAEVLLGDDDGFVCCAHNFYLYDHPRRGLLFVPWDFDDTLELIPYATDPVEGYGRGMYAVPQVRLLMDVPEHRARFAAHLAALLPLLDALPAQVDAFDAQLGGAPAADPLRTWGLDERAQTLARLKDWLPARRAYLEAWTRCEAGDAEDRDGDGLPPCADLHDGLARGPELCDGLDNDHNGVIDDGAALLAPGPDGRVCDDCALRELIDREGGRRRRYLHCAEPRSRADAEARCAAAGGALGAIPDDAAWTMTWLYTWPGTSRWWLGGGSGGRCAVWDAGAGRTSTADCGGALPSICALP